MSGAPPRLPSWALGAVALGWSAIVYGPIVANFFFADDFLNLYRIANLSPLEYVLTPHGGHVLLVRNALFWLSRTIFGLHVEFFFVVVLCTHLLNVALLFAAARALTGSALLACIAATAWGGAPLHQGTLGWYSVYGQVVTGTGMLAVLAGAARLRADGHVPTRATLRIWYALALVAATSFGVGLGAAMALPLAIALLLPDWRRWSRRLPLVSLYLVVPAIYVGVHALYGALVGGPLPGGPEMSAAIRATLPAGSEPSTPMLLLAYLRSTPQMLLMLFEMVAYACAQLLAASAPISRAGPLAWAAALALVAGACLVATRIDPTRRRVVLALAALAVGCYATIALGRGVALQAIGIAHGGLADRYHYAATAPLALLIAVALRGLAERFGVGAGVGRAATAVWLGWIVGSYALWAPRIDHHDVAREATERVLTEIARVAAAAPPGDPVYIVNRHFGPTARVLTPVHFPGWSAVYIAFSLPGAERSAHFVEANSAVVAAARRGRRSAEVLVTSERVPAGVTVLQPEPVDATLLDVPFGFPPLAAE